MSNPDSDWFQRLSLSYDPPSPAGPPAPSAIARAMCFACQHLGQDGRCLVHGVIIQNRFAAAGRCDSAQESGQNFSRVFMGTYWLSTSL